MRRLTLIVCLMFPFVLILASPAVAQTVLDRSVLSNGGSETSGANHTSTAGERNEYRITSANDVGLTFHSDGFFGNNLRDRSPSFEYPVGSSQDHMIRGGAWVGGVSAAGDTLVSIVTFDGYIGVDPIATEFIPDGLGILERSILPNSPYYDPENARSEQDFLCGYHDSLDTQPPHTPLSVYVHQEILQWSFEPFDAIILFNLEIVNTHPIQAIVDPFVGFYAELVSGWKDGHDEWPPYEWFVNKDIAYVDSLRLVTEHHYQLDGGNCPSWGGLALLGTIPDPIDELQVSFNWWNWDPDGHDPETPATDPDKYLMLGNGEIDATAGSEGPENDPVTLLSVGPLGTSSFRDHKGDRHWVLDPGGSVLVCWAFVGGKPSPDGDPPRTAEEDIAYNAWWAHFAHQQWCSDVNGRPRARWADETAGPQLVMRGGASPNPFGTKTAIRFELRRSQHVQLSVCDVAGRKIARLANHLFPAGLTEITWDGRSDAGDALPSGCYFYRIQTAQGTAVRRMLLIR